MDLVFPVVARNGMIVGKDLKRTLIAHVFDTVVKNACRYIGYVLNHLLLGCIRSFQ
jgi:hypothetical protein